MNYKKTYNNLIERAKTRTLSEEIYVETHHILPKCIGGSNGKDNLVVLTFREHFIAHWLLVKIYPKEWKLYFAFFQMTKKHNHERILNSRQFETARKSLSDGARIRFELGLSPKKTPEGRKRLSDKMLGDKNPMRKFPEKNRTARQHIVVFEDGSVKEYLYGKLGYEDLCIPRSTWIGAVINKTGIPKYNIKKIIKENK
jgi:hypothetical protein